MLRAEAPAFLPGAPRPLPPPSLFDVSKMAYLDTTCPATRTALPTFYCGSPRAGATIEAGGQVRTLHADVSKRVDSEFKLSGLEDLQKSLASLLSGKVNSQPPTADGASPSTSAGRSSTTGSSTPTLDGMPTMSREPSVDGEEDSSLPAPPGLQGFAAPLTAPPGLEGYVTKMAKAEEVAPSLMEAVEVTPAPSEVTEVAAAQEVALFPADAVDAAPPTVQLTEVACPEDKEEVVPAPAVAPVADDDALPPLPARKKRASIPESSPAATATTTFMLHQLPKRCSRDMLLDHFKRAGFDAELDFLYLPADLKTMSNVGHAVLNFRSEEAAERFSKAFHGATAKEVFQGCGGSIPKGRCEVVPATVQGLEANVRKLRQSGLLMSMLVCKPAWLPLVRDEEDLLVPLPDQDDSSD